MLRETELSLQAIGFYAILRDFNGHSGCYPKQATLAKRARISPRYTRICTGSGFLDKSAA